MTIRPRGLIFRSQRLKSPRGLFHLRSEFDTVYDTTLYIDFLLILCYFIPQVLANARHQACLVPSQWKDSGTLSTQRITGAKAFVWQFVQACLRDPSIPQEFRGMMMHSTMTMGDNECLAVAQVLVHIHGARCNVSASLQLERPTRNEPWLHGKCDLHMVDDPERVCASQAGLRTISSRLSLRVIQIWLSPSTSTHIRALVHINTTNKIVRPRGLSSLPSE